MKKDIILFDLDGTLTDPMIGITKSVQFALRKCGVEVEDLNRLCCFIGPPLHDSFQEYYHFSEEETKKAIGFFREYFESGGLFENKVYPEMEDLLKSLVDARKKLYVATSKPEVFAAIILEHFSLSHYFTFIGGADMEETRVKKGDVIHHVMTENQIEERDRMVMVGDRKHDILGAREHDILSVGVLYGYGDRAEHEAAGADYIVESVSELKELLLKL